MMDASPLYESPPHPWDADMRRDWKGEAQASTRTLHPVKYFFIDYGLSRRYTAAECPPSEEIIMGGAKDAPEFLSGQTHADPFPTDVWYLGEMIKSEFFEVTSLCDRVILVELNEF